MCKYPCCIIGGMVLGATLGMMVFPQLDRRTQRSMRRAGNRVLNMAEDTFMGMNATAWTWLVIGVLGVLVIGLIWYYGKDHTPITQDLDEK